MNRKITLLAMAFSGVLLLVMLCSPVSAIDTKRELMPGQYHIEYFEYSNRTEADAERRAQTHLVVYKDIDMISFTSEKKCSLFIMNKTQMLAFVENGTLDAKQSWPNITSYQEILHYKTLTEEYKVETYLFNKTGGKPTWFAAMYFVVRNEVNSTNYFSLRVCYRNQFMTFLEDFFRIVVSFIFLYFGIKLFGDARQALKENQPSKRHIYNNYGISFLFGTLTTAVWEVYHWYARLEPSESWLQPLSFSQMPDFPIFSANILSFVSFASLGFSVIFMSNTVEKIVQNRKVPLFTYILFAMEALVIACIFVPAILLYVFYVWLGTLLLASINVLATYIKVARITSGDLKKQAILITVCLLTLYLSISLVRTLVVPEFVANILSTIFIFGLYNSLRMAREVRKREEMPQTVQAS
ncbi:MAG: hypothetical protein Q6373_024855 [Candidatus Sigynarchaeota archaeon]